jgi:hypothetical protein
MPEKLPHFYPEGAEWHAIGIILLAELNCLTELATYERDSFHSCR